jgi:putative DNA primase/helicase
MEKHIEAREVREIAAGRWLDLLGALAPGLESALDRVGRHVPCPVHGGSDGFRLFRNADQTGGGVCNTCGTFPDGFALLMWVNRWSFPEALRSVAHALDLAAEPVPEPRAVPSHRRRPERDRESVIEAINRVWQQSLDPTDRRAAPLRTYLSRRGLSGSRLDGEVVRFHPALCYWQRNDRDEAELFRRFPAMLALVTGADGMLMTVHRTYLTADGRKAPVPEPKKLMGYADRRLVGGAIRLAATGPACSPAWSRPPGLPWSWCGRIAIAPAPARRQRCLCASACSGEASRWRCICRRGRSRGVRRESTGLTFGVIGRNGLLPDSADRYFRDKDHAR